MFFMYDVGAEVIWPSFIRSALCSCLCRLLLFTLNRDRMWEGEVKPISSAVYWFDAKTLQCIALECITSCLCFKGRECAAISIMAAEVKQFLYAWCGKQKTAPNYEQRTVGSKIRPRFMCEVGMQNNFCVKLLFLITRTPFDLFISTSWSYKL